MRSRHFTLVLLITAGLIVSACGSATTSSAAATNASSPSDVPASLAPVPSPSAADRSITIAQSFPTLGIQYFNSLKTDMESKTAAKGWGYISVGSDSDAAKQVNDVENLLQQKPAILFFQAIDAAAAQPVVDAAKALGIPVVSLFDESLTGTAATMTLQPESEGRESCKVLIERLGGVGKVAIISGAAGEFAQRREKGCTDALATAPGIEVVAKQNGDWTRATGLQIAEDMLQAHPDITAFAGGNDDSVLGALEAVRGKGRDPKDVPIVGIDGSADAMTEVCNGNMAATFATLFTDESDIMIDLTERIVLSNETFTAPVPFNGQLVTITNVRELAQTLGYTLPATCVS